MPNVIDYKAVFDALPDACMLVAPDFTVIEANEACLRIFSSDHAGVIGRQAIELFVGESTESGNEFMSMLHRSYERTLTSRMRESVPLFKRPVLRATPQGHSSADRFLKLVHTPVMDATGKVAMICTQISDVTVDVAADGAAPPQKNGTEPVSRPSSGTAPAAEPDNAPPPEQRRSLRILFVEDNDDLRESTSQVLERLGHTVVSVGDAEDALACLEKESFNVLFSDLTLPKMTGKELAKEVAARYPETKIVITSGYGRAMADLRDLQAVMLPKPYRIADLTAVLNGAA